MPTGIRKTGDIAPLGVRMQADLKDALTAAARKNGRSLNAEVVVRLELSFQQPVTLGVMQEVAPYAAPRRVLTQCQEMMLEIFDSLPPDKQLALISLFR